MEIKYVCKRGVIPSEKLSKNYTYFTLLDLTLLNGEPLMCVLIFAGKCINKQVEVGVDPFTEEVGIDTNGDYMIKIWDLAKYFLGGGILYLPWKRYHMRMSIEYKSKHNHRDLDHHR